MNLRRHAGVGAALTTIVATTLLIAACGSEGEESGSDQATNTSTSESPAVDAPLELEVTTDVAYTSERDLDIYAPVEGSDWPVVVYFHGGVPAPGARTEPQALSAIAEQGVVVYAPDWRSIGPAGGSQDSVCAVAYAQSTAAEHGGDPEAMTLAGYSTGGFTALVHGFVAADPPLPVTDCAVEPVTDPPSAVAVGGTPLFAPQWAREGRLPAPAWTQLTPEQIDAFDPELLVGENPDMVVNLFVAEDDQGGPGAPPGGWPITEANREYHPELLAAGYSSELVVVPGGHVLDEEGRAAFTEFIVDTATTQSSG